MINSREQILTELEVYWCDRMTELVHQNRINDADSVFSEFVVDGKEPFEQEWIFIPHHKAIQ